MTSTKNKKPPKSTLHKSLAKKAEEHAVTRLRESPLHLVRAYDENGSKILVQESRDEK